MFYSFPRNNLCGKFHASIESYTSTELVTNKADFRRCTSKELFFDYKSIDKDAVVENSPAVPRQFSWFEERSWRVRNPVGIPESLLDLLITELPRNAIIKLLCFSTRCLAPCYIQTSNTTDVSDRLWICYFYL